MFFNGIASTIYEIIQHRYLTNPIADQRFYSLRLQYKQYYSSISL